MKFFNELIASSLVNEFTQQIVVDKKAHFLKNLIKQMYSYTNVEEFHVYAQKIYTFSGLNFDTEAIFFGLYDEYYRLFLQQNSLILENYLVYAVYTSLFPFYSKNIWDDYIMLFLRYAVVNLFLFGLTVNGKGIINKVEFIKCFVLISKILDSSEPPAFVQVVLEEMKQKNEIDNLNIFKLIKA